MEQTLRPLPSVYDPKTQDVFRKSLGNLAGQVAARQNEMQHILDHAQTEPPPLFCTATATEAPPAIPGALWFVVSSSRLFYYSATYLTWLEANATVVGGNQTTITISAGRYAISRVALPDHAFITTVYVGAFSTAGVAGHVDVVQVGGGVIGTTTFSIGATLYSEIAISVNLPYAVATGIQVEMYVTSGTLPSTDVQFRYRRTPV